MKTIPALACAALMAAPFPLSAADTGCIVADNSTDVRYPAYATLPGPVVGAASVPSPVAVDLRGGTYFSIFPFVFNLGLPGFSLSIK